MKPSQSAENQAYNAQEQFSMYSNMTGHPRDGFLNTPRLHPHVVPPQLPPPVLYSNNHVDTVMTPIHGHGTVYTQSAPLYMHSPETTSPLHAFSNSFYVSPTRSMPMSRSNNMNSNNHNIVYTSPSSSQALPNRPSSTQKDAKTRVIGHNLITKGSLKLDTKFLQLPSIPSENVIIAEHTNILDSTDIHESVGTMEHSNHIPNIHEHSELSLDLDPIAILYSSSSDVAITVEDKSPPSGVEQDNTLEDMKAYVLHLESLLQEKEEIINQKNALLQTKDGIISSKDLVLRQKDQVIGEKNMLQSQKETILNDTNSLLGEKEDILTQKKELLSQKELELQNISILNDSIVHSKEEHTEKLEVENKTLQDENISLKIQVKKNQADITSLQSQKKEQQTSMISQKDEKEQKLHSEISKLRLDMQQYKKVTHLLENDKLQLLLQVDSLQDQLKVVQASHATLSEGQNVQNEVEVQKYTVDTYQQQNQALTKRLQMYSTEIEHQSHKLTQKDVDIHKQRASWETERLTERREWGNREEALTQHMDLLQLKSRKLEHEKKDELRSALEALDIGDSMMKSMQERLEAAEEQKKLMKVDIERLENRMKWLTTQKHASEYIQKNNVEANKLDAAPKYVDSDKWSTYSELMQKQKK